MVQKINTKSDFYIIGGGIAGLSAAVYLIQEGKINGKHITIYDKAKRLGGALDIKSNSEGYIMRGIRMFEEEAYTCTFDLMSRIPALNKKHTTIRDKFIKFNEKFKTYSKARLIENGKPINSKPLKISIKDRIKLSALFLKKENSIEELSLSDYFSPSFFKSNFWYEFCTVFAFEPWHSLMEFRRYSIRFIQSFYCINTLEKIEISPYNQYESMVLPIIDWLKEEGVNFEPNTKIINYDFEKIDEKKRITKIYYKKDSEEIMKELIIENNDYVFTTLGSMVANSSSGTMKNAPVIDFEKKTAARTLWENIAEKNPEFGNPYVFNSHKDKSKWIAFTITLKNHNFFDLMQKFVNKKESDFGGVNLINSNWFMSIVLTYKPYFVDQPDDVNICWGYGLFSEKEGNFVKKKMYECSGEEIMTELLYHLGFEKEMKDIIKTSICIPTSTPYVTSQFLPRKTGDRPLVVPKTSLNFAFLGQFCEIPNDIVFTVEYSVRSAQTAVYKLLNLNKKVSPIYKGYRNPKVLFNAMKTLFR